jgi:hypothetical protein
LNQKPQGPRLGGIELGIVGNDEGADLAQRGRAVGLDRIDPPVQPVAKADGLGVLVDLDAVEDAAAHIARALEGIVAVSGDEDGVLAGLEIARSSVANPLRPEGCARSPAATRGRHRVR